MVCDTKANGGLEVINLQTKNHSLLLKNHHNFFKRLDIISVQPIWEVRYSNRISPARTRKSSFRWLDIQKLFPIFKGMAMATIQNGSS